MRKFYLEIGEEKTDTFLMKVVLKNFEEFQHFCDETIERVREYRSETKQYKYREVVFLGNLRIFGYILEKYFPEDLEITKDMDYLIQKKLAHEDGYCVTSINYLDTNYIRFRDLNTMSGHDAPFWTREVFEKYAPCADFLFAKYGEKMPHSLSYMVAKNIQSCVKFKEISFRCHRTKKDEDLMRLMNYEEISKFQPYIRSGLNIWNKKFAGKELTNVYKVDFNSAYIYQMHSKKFPMSEPVPLENLDELRRIRSLGFCWIAKFVIKVTRLHNENLNPYNVELNKNHIQYLTCLDYTIFKDAYDFKLTFQEGYYFRTVGELPEEFKKIFMTSYHEKENMKLKKGTPEFDSGLYQVSKIITNAYSGMLGRKSFRFDYSNKFWAIFVTAWQRFDLWRYIRKLGNDFLYCHTDSIFSLRPSDAKIGAELGEAESEFCSKFVYKGANRYIYKVDDQIEICVGGAVREGVREWANNVGEIAAFAMFQAPEAIIPYYYNICIGYAFDEASGQIYFKKFNYTLKGE